MPTSYEPPTCIKLTKDQASQIAIGDKTSFTVSGEVTAIRARMGFTGDAEKVEGYEVELKKSKVTSISGNPAEKALKDLKGE